MMFFAVLSQHTLTVAITDTSVCLHNLRPIIVHFITSPDCSGNSLYSFLSSQILFAKYFQPFIESQNPRTRIWGSKGPLDTRNPPHGSQQSPHVSGSCTVPSRFLIFPRIKTPQCLWSSNGARHGCVLLSCGATWLVILSFLKRCFSAPQHLLLLYFSPGSWLGISPYGIQYPSSRKWLSLMAVFANGLEVGLLRMPVHFMCGQ